MFGIGPMELVLILVVALLVLGPKRMPELARMLGRGLGEFRRASNDLRQSLALDDLQSDLRNGLTGAGTVKKPDQDRPAQAGDDLAPGTDGTADDDATRPESDSTSQAHPGELPLDDDSTTHHDVGDDAENETVGESATPQEMSAAPESSPKPSAADSVLGNVPVGGANPAASKKPTGEERG